MKLNWQSKIYLACYASALIIPMARGILLSGCPSTCLLHKFICLFFLYLCGIIGGMPEVHFFYWITKCILIKMVLSSTDTLSPWLFCSLSGGQKMEQRVCSSWRATSPQSEHWPSALMVWPWHLEEWEASWTSGPCGYEIHTNRRSWKHPHRIHVNTAGASYIDAQMYCVKHMMWNMKRWKEQMIHHILILPAIIHHTTVYSDTEYLCTGVIMCPRSTGWVSAPDGRSWFRGDPEHCLDPRCGCRCLFQQVKGKTSPLIHIFPWFT